MNAAALPDCPYDATPEVACEAIAVHTGPVFVDLDETLYLRNSTEDFIDLARPGLLALLLLRGFDLLKPWHWTGGERTRDVWRVGLIWTLFPWTRLRWRRRVSNFAQRYGNHPLIQALQSREIQPVVVTAGFGPIVAPLIAALGFPDARTVAARLGSCEDRRLGKLHNAVHTLGREAVCSSLFVTDSMDDRAMLQECARPVRTIWPAARFRRALGHVYLPGNYVTQVKRPGERYIARVILTEDLGFWVLASIGLASRPLLHVVGLILLLISFWCIYERGYVDNDWAAVQFEHNPKLSDAFWEAPVATPRWKPWIWAIASAALALWVLHWPSPPHWQDMIKWLAVLLGTYGCFKLYNRLDKSTRVWLFAGLQMARSASFVVLVPVSIVGAIGLGAHGLSRWVPYYIYRFGSHKDWPEAQPKLIRILFFVILTALLGISNKASAFTWTTFALFFYSIYRARVELRELLHRFHRIDRDRNLQQ